MVLNRFWVWHLLNTTEATTCLCRLPGCTKSKFWSSQQLISSLSMVLKASVHCPWKCLLRQAFWLRVLGLVLSFRVAGALSRCQQGSFWIETLSLVSRELWGLIIYNTLHCCGQNSPSTLNVMDCLSSAIQRTYSAKHKALSRHWWKGFFHLHTSNLILNYRGQCVEIAQVEICSSYKLLFNCRAVMFAVW